MTTYLYSAMLAYIVWVLVRDYLDSEITNRAINHAYSITDNGDISGFFGEFLVILIRYSAKLKIEEWKVAKEGRVEQNFLNKTQGMGAFLSQVVNVASDFMKRLMKHTVHNVRNRLTRDDLGRIGWVLWGQHNAEWYKTRKIEDYLSTNPLDPNYYLFISIQQSYDTKDEDTEMIALVLSYAWRRIRMNSTRYMLVQPPLMR